MALTRSLETVSVPVRSRFLSIFNPVEDEQVFGDGRILTLLKEMPDNVALAALNEYAYAVNEVGSNIRNKAGFLVSIIRKHQSGERIPLQQPLPVAQPRVQYTAPPPSTGRIPMRLSNMAGPDGLTRPVKIKLEQLYGTNILRRDQVDNRCMDAIRNLSEDDAFSALSEISRMRDIGGALDPSGLLLSIFQNFSQPNQRFQEQGSYGGRNQYDQPSGFGQQQQQQIIPVAQTQSYGTEMVLVENPPMVYQQAVYPNQGGSGMVQQVRVPQQSRPAVSQPTVYVRSGPNFNQAAVVQYAPQQYVPQQVPMTQQRSGHQAPYTQQTPRVGSHEQGGYPRGRDGPIGQDSRGRMDSRNEQFVHQPTYFGPPPPGTERMSVAVQQRMGALYGSGAISPHDVEPRALEMLERLPENIALRAIDEFFNVDKSLIRKLGAFFTGVMRKNGESIGLFSQHSTPAYYQAIQRGFSRERYRDVHDSSERPIRNHRSVPPSYRDHTETAGYGERRWEDDRKRGREDDYRSREPYHNRHTDRRDIKYPRVEVSRGGGGDRRGAFKGETLDGALFPYLQRKLTLKAYEGFLELVHQGRLIASEVDDERIGDAAVRLKESEVLGALTEFKNCDLSKVRNKCAYLMGLLKRYRTGDEYEPGRTITKRIDKVDIGYRELADLDFASEALHKSNSSRNRDDDRGKLDLKSKHDTNNKERHSKSKEKDGQSKRDLKPKNDDKEGKKQDSKLKPGEKVGRKRDLKSDDKETSNRNSKGKIESKDNAKKLDTTEDGKLKIDSKPKVESQKRDSKSKSDNKNEKKVDNKDSSGSKKISIKTDLKEKATTGKESKLKSSKSKEEIKKNSSKLKTEEVKLEKKPKKEEVEDNIQLDVMLKVGDTTKEENVSKLEATSENNRNSEKVASISTKEAVAVKAEYELDKNLNDQDQKANSKIYVDLNENETKQTDITEIPSSIDGKEENIVKIEDASLSSTIKEEIIIIHESNTDIPNINMVVESQSISEATAPLKKTPNRATKPAKTKASTGVKRSKASPTGAEVEGSAKPEPPQPILEKKDAEVREEQSKTSSTLDMDTTDNIAISNISETVEVERNSQKSALKPRLSRRVKVEARARDLKTSVAKDTAVELLEKDKVNVESVQKKEDIEDGSITQVGKRGHTRTSSNAATKLSKDNEEINTSPATKKPKKMHPSSRGRGRKNPSSSTKSAPIKVAKKIEMPGSIEASTEILVSTPQKVLNSTPTTAPKSHADEKNVDVSGNISTKESEPFVDESIKFSPIILEEMNVDSGIENVEIVDDLKSELSDVPSDW